MRNLFKKILILFLIIGMINHISASTVEAAAIYKAEVNSPSINNIFISVSGTYTTVDTKAVVDRLNQIRKEACKEGVINPATGKKLTMSDYKPVSWSSVLEEYARIRAAEVAVNWDHQRPSNKSTFNNTTTKKLKGYHSGENIAMGYNLLKSIEAYYSEKNDWVKKTGEMTGHYENIIRPLNTLVGMSGIKVDDSFLYSAMELGVAYSANDSKRIGYSGQAVQLVDVSVPYLVKSIYISGNNSLKVGQSTKLKVKALMKDEMEVGTVYSNIKWASSNSKVATVDQNGNVKAVSQGTANINVTAGGKSASYKITVIGNVKVNGVKLNVTSKTMNVGDSYSLSATISPSNATNKKVTYTSSNTKVATVNSEGKMIAKAAGTATITVKTADGSKTATCKVTVNKIVKATSIKLNATSKTIYVGNSFNLKATINPTNTTNKKVTYTSSNTRVATVDKNGKVSARGEGVATITVTTTDGSKKTAICKVTVKHPVRVTGVMLNKTNVTIKAGKTYQLKATISPSNATNKSVTWSSGNTTIATVDKNGLITAKKPGVVIITATTKDRNKTAKISVLVVK